MALEARVHHLRVAALEARVLATDLPLPAIAVRWTAVFIAGQKTTKRKMTIVLSLQIQLTAAVRS